MEQVILRVGDILTKYHDCIENTNNAIAEITKDQRVYRKCALHYSVQFHECEYWYVNGKKYHRDNLIIPQIETDNKVTLKVGDVFSSNPSGYNVSENNEFYRILDFKNGRIIRSETLDICIDKMEDYYWVNGKRYHRDDIIIPNQVVQSHDEIDHVVEANEMVEITPENIKEVLEYNNISRELYSITSSCIKCQSLNEQGYNHFDFVNPLWLQLVEVYFGKLKPLPKPQFDFEEYINQNISKDYAGYLARLWAGVANGQRPMFPCTKENADILIEMVKLSEELEYEEV